MASQPHQGPADTTFRNYSSQQAAKYAATRSGYSPTLIEYIVKHHCATGGQTGVVLDVGCGPGNATRDISSHFSRVVGADPGEGMIEVATELAGTTSTGAPIEWRVSSAEDIDKIPDLKHGSVDMITAATAAHWFDMPKFWEAAGKLLKPGGTVALWVIYPLGILDSDNEKSQQLRELFAKFNKDVLGPYITPRNHLAGTGYANLEMPWDQEHTAAIFEKDTFLRRRWESTDEVGDGQDFFDPSTRKPWPIPVAEAMMGTLSPVTRWREAHADLVGTDKDCVKVLMKQVCQILGVTEGEEMSVALRGGVGISLLCIKKA